MVGEVSANDSSIQYQWLLIRPYKALYCTEAWEQMIESTEAYQNSTKTPMCRLDQLALFYILSDSHMLHGLFNSTIIFSLQVGFSVGRNQLHSCTQTSNTTESPLHQRAMAIDSVSIPEIEMSNIRQQPDSSVNALRLVPEICVSNVLKSAPHCFRVCNNLQYISISDMT